MNEDEFKLKMEQFSKFLNNTPRKTKIDTRNGKEGIPISEIEVMLDTIFFGLWQSEITDTIIVGNEIVMNVKLGVFHPIAKQWIWRGGSGACMIRQTKDSKISDIDSKIKNAVEMDAPHAKAAAIKNAAMSLGDSFGRNLRRKTEDISRYIPLHTPHILKKLEVAEIEKAAKRYAIEGNLDFIKANREVTPEQETEIIELSKTLKVE